MRSCWASCSAARHTRSPTGSRPAPSAPGTSSRSSSARHRERAMDELEQLIAAGEGEHVAFLKEHPRLDELAETLVAFANRSGGTLLLGVGGRRTPQLG